MSLFKVRDFWEAQGSEDEEYSGVGSICFHLIDGLDCLVTGNLAGVIRVFHVEGLVGYKADHLLIEKQLEQPILQVSFGRFSSHSPELSTCILHPRKISVVSIKANALGGSTQLEASLETLYQHKLERCSYLFAQGPFGGATVKDLICVQSVDGVLSVFDQESHAFDRPLPGVVLPGPLAYMDRTDSFVTVTSSFTLETFRYQVLASATLSDDAQPGVRGKRVISEWSRPLGEMVTDIKVANGLNEQLIFCLGEQTLFVLKSNADLMYTKRFDFNPRCFHVYARDPNDPFLFTMVASQNNTILVYEKTQLRWAAQVDDTPGITAALRADFTFQKGTIVLLNDNAKIRLCYLGTSPSLFVAAAPERRELSTDPQELKKLHAIASGAVKLDETCSRPLSVDLHLGGLQMLNGVPAQTVQITLEPPTNTPPLEARVLVVPPPPFTASPLEFNLTQCEGKTTLETTISPRKEFTPADMVLHVTVIYRHPKLGIRISRGEIDLPLELVVRIHPNPPKSAKFKVTLESSQAALSPSELFPTLLKDSGMEVEFEYFNGNRVGFFVSGNKYRIQGDVYPSLALMVDHCIKKVQKAQADIILTTKPPVFDDFLQVIADHIQSILALEDTEKRLEQLASQYRAVEKRLLAKTKDKTPSPFNNLDKLLEMTHHDLLRTSDEGIRVQAGLPVTASALNAAGVLVTHLLVLSSRIPQSYAGTVVNLLNFFQFWEEQTTSALCSLMKQLKIGKGLHESSGLQALLAILWDNQVEEEIEEPQRKIQHLLDSVRDFVKRFARRCGVYPDSIDLPRIENLQGSADLNMLKEIIRTDELQQYNNRRSGIHPESKCIARSDRVNNLAHFKKARLVETFIHV